jgi:hypothetical protein
LEQRKDKAYDKMRVNKLCLYILFVVTWPHHAQVEVIVASVSAAIAGASLAQGIITLQTAGDMNCNRNVVLEIENHLKDRNLHYDGDYMYSGVCRIPCQGTITSGRKEACGFSKIWDTATGCCGIARYTTQGLTAKLNIDIIFDNGYSTSTRFGIHIGMQGDVRNSPSKDNVFNGYKEWPERQWFHWAYAKSGHAVTAELDGIEVVATMGDAHQAIMKVEIWGGDRWKFKVDL